MFNSPIFYFLLTSIFYLYLLGIIMAEIIMNFFASQRDNVRGSPHLNAGKEN